MFRCAEKHTFHRIVIDLIRSEAQHAPPSKSVEAEPAKLNMNNAQPDNYVAAPAAARTRVRGYTWPHGMPADEGISTASACASIVFDVLRTVKGDYGSSG